jgi:hypothetical protein
LGRRSGPHGAARPLGDDELAGGVTRGQMPPTSAKLPVGSRFFDLLISCAPPGLLRRTATTTTDHMPFIANASRASWRILLAPLLCLGGCSHEREFTSEPRISVSSDDRALVGLHKIRGAGADLGYMETWTVADGSRKIYRVTDLKRTPLGFVDDSGRAYRYTAHEGTQLAAQHDDLSHNVRAVMNLNDVERFELVDQVPAAAR